MDSRVKTVLSFEFLAIARKKGYIILTTVLSLIVFAGFFIPGYLNRSPDQPIIDEVINNEEAFFADDRQILFVSGTDETTILGMMLPQFELQPHDTMSSDQLALVFEGDLNSYGQLTLAGSQARLDVKSLSMGDSMPSIIHDAVKEYHLVTVLQAAGIDETEVMDQLRSFSFQVNDLAAESGKGQTQMYMYTYVVLMLLYMSVLIYGQIVASNVASEKGNRTMELLITSTKPSNLLVGKVIGSGLAGLLQLFLILASALLSYRINRDHLTGLFWISAITLAMVAYTLLFFTLGYFTYAFLFSALGSLVSRAEEVNKSVTAISLPLILIFMVAMTSLITPTAGYVTVLSFVPFFSPFLMLIRTQMLVVPGWQILLAVAINLVTLAGVAYISAKIYRLGTLFYGNTVKLKSLYRMLKY